MAKKILARRIPIIGKSGLLAIIGCIFGVIIDKLLRDYALKPENKWARQPVIAGVVNVDDCIGLALPLVLLVVVRRYRAFFVGWLAGALATVVYERVKKEEAWIE